VSTRTLRTFPCVDLDIDDKLGEHQARHVLTSGVAVAMVTMVTTVVTSVVSTITADEIIPIDLNSSHSVYRDIDTIPRV